MRTRRLSSLLGAFGAALAMLATLCVGASATRRPHATFTVTAEGTQALMASKPAEGEECPAGTASDSIQFVSKPVRVRIEDTGPFLELVGLSSKGEDGRQPLTISGSVARAVNGSFVCQLDRERPLDCGTKPFSSLPMWLQGSSLRRGRITLSLSLRAEDPPDVFGNCPVQRGYPNVLALEVPQLRTAATELFDHRRHTIVLTSSRSTSADEGGASSHTTMTVKLTLRRL
jgi:hypothetical protein